ncbi:sensor histidine kinase [Brunnivagina elsteri]|uniref:histidine kinase n=1 Tax=Brunnivagina elsteri CCALA 953 TaxID=987040 RepID=A0A2A2TG20_9CYAN|nr:PAS domain-containing sensor histidine kinase [Calothrix elsteri]PAX52641.1 diguanylate cyclase [Calothrix elsteri CCALA 953]
MTNLDFSLLEKIATSLPGVIFQILQKQNNSLIISASSGCHELCELQLEVIQNDFNILLNLLRSQDIHTFIELVTVSSITLAPWCWQGEILTLSSKNKWVQISVHPQKQANGDILWEGLVMDITKHKLTEDNLRASEGRYKAILDAIPDLMFRISGDGEYLDFKGEGANVTIPREQIVGKNLWDLLPSDVARDSYAAICRTLASRSLQTCEYQLPTALGMRDYEARLVISGKAEVLAIVRDITENKKTETTLKHLAEKFSKAFRCSPDPITISTLAEGRYIDVNNSFVRLTGYERDETVGKTALELNIWVNPSDRTQLLRELNNTGAVNNLEFEFRCKSGEVIIAQLSAEIIDLEGVKCILAINKNITKSKQAESQLHKLNTNLERQVEERTAQLQEKVQEIQELSRIKDVMLHTVSHDLRTSVIGNLMVLNNLIREQVGNRERQTGDSPIAQSIVERMIEGNERQLGMIDSLLEINSSDTKALIMNQEIVKFSTLIKAIVQDIASLLNKYQAKLDNSIGENFPTVKADQELLRKLFVALLTYTCQNNPPGLKIILKARVEAGKIRCTIQDNGIEISKIECDRFFDLHIREPQSRSSTCTSLKLYMCRQIIKAHGGEISVISNRKRGLTILFTLPIVN